MDISIGTISIGGCRYFIDASRHVSIIGSTGVGKSSLLEHLFLEFVKQGHGGLFLDVHGDTADRLAMLIPKNRARDLIWFDPDADSVPPLNPLYFTDPTELELAKESTLTLLKALAGSESAWGNETPHNVRSDLDDVTELVNNPTLVHVYRWLIDEDYRESLLGKSDNPFIKLFKKAFEKLRQQDQSTKLAPAINKLSKLMRPNILPILGHPLSIDPLRIMNENKVMICRISKGRLGEETAMILYSLIVSMFSIAALKREKQDDRPPFMIVADEAQNGVHGGRFGTLLAEARKYGISLVTAFQGAYQMPIISDVLTNAGTQIIFNSSGADAKLLSENWHDDNVLPTHITGLSRYEFYSRTFEGNQPIVRKVKAPKPLKPRRDDPEPLIRQSLMRWGKNKAQTLENISSFLAN